MRNIFLIINAFFYLNFFATKKDLFLFLTFIILKKNKKKEALINKILIFWHQNDSNKNKKILIKIKNSSILKFNENSII